ncbi:MAG TPA: hypothetical protein PLD88_05115 [Candidatus Berkiella sp.]|nr:hypothetical protein [Candidatus Berkiella sp.]
MFNLLSFVGIGGNTANLADDALNIIRNANDATNSKLEKKRRGKARQSFIENMVNVGGPLAVGAVVGAVGSPAGAIPATQMAQSLAKSFGMGKFLGKTLHPVLAPIANLFGFFKRKIKDKIGLDIGKWLNFGVNVAQPVASSTNVLSCGSKVPSSRFNPNPLKDISNVTESKHRYVTHNASRSISPLGTRLRQFYARPAMQPSDKSRVRNSF